MNKDFLGHDNEEIERTSSCLVCIRIMKNSKVDISSPDIFPSSALMGTYSLINIFI